MVQSARLQSLIAGDDATLTHSLVEQAVVGNAIGLQAVALQNGDAAACVYGNADGSTVSVAATPVGSLPSSQIQVVLSQAQTALLQPGCGQTVRVEITRSGGKKETHYLYREYDVLARGLPEAPEWTNLEV